MDSPRSPHRLSVLLALACAAGVLGTGCVTVYQPMASLQRPVAVDPRLKNFEGAHLLVRCVPNDDLRPADAELLCRKLGTLFRNQGAKVETEVPREGRAGRATDEANKPDLVLDVRSRLLHEEKNNGLGVLCAFTLTLVPMMEEQSFAQDVTVRDSSGSLLASDSLQSRFIEYFGVGVWGVNWVADLLLRSEADKITGDVAQREFSNDLYSQLSQLMLNARVRSQVLHDFEPQTN